MKKLIKGTIQPIIVKLLSEKPKMYGYELTQEVKELTQGKIKLTFGALYPTLHKLEAEGILRTETQIVEGRARKYYSLTKKGKVKALEMIDELEQFVKTMNLILQSKNNLDYA